MKKCLLFSLLVGFILSSCLVFPSFAANGEARIWVFDSNSVALEGVVFTLTDSAGGTFSKTTNAAGYASIANLPVGDYTGTFVKDVYTIGKKIVKYRILENQITKSKIYLRKRVLKVLALDGDDRPLRDVTVSFRGAAATTLADGVAEFDGVIAGAAPIACSKAGTKFATINVNVSADAFQTIKPVTGTKTTARLIVTNGAENTPVRLHIAGVSEAVWTGNLDSNGTALATGFFTAGSYIFVITPPGGSDFGVKSVNFEINNVGEITSVTTTLTTVSFVKLTAANAAELAVAINTANTNGVPTLIQLTSSMVAGPGVTFTISGDRTIFDGKGYT
ncbi:MAG: prealbumin-like fold domain-containing protein, partial [Candidatus Margulisbacteria bacterium]|nr:prealbumin-like fold domain-containing protein [Candidatus Margulisiibacteriota bacterium]